MSKYINADEFISYIRKKTTPSGAEWTARRVREMPSADVAEIVRCKDCKYYDNKNAQCEGYFVGPVGDDDFCSYAERRKSE